MQKSIGQQLSAARKRKRISLANVAEELYIREEILLLMEQDRFEELPSIAQARGFLRLYADFLKLDRSRILDQLTPPEPDLDENTPSVPEEAEEEGGFIRIKETAQQMLSGIFTNNDKPDKAASKTDPVTSSTVIAEENTVVVHAAAEAEKIFEEIGAEIRHNRETLGLSLKDLEQVTAIKAKHLEWIEAGKLGNFSSPIQARGLLNNYVSYMSMDVDAIMLRYANAMLADRHQDPKTSSGPKKRLQAGRFLAVLQYISPNLFIALFLIISMACLLVWGINRTTKASMADPTVSAPPISEVLLSTQEPTQEVISIGEATNIALTEESIFVTPDAIATLDVNIASQTPTKAGRLQMNVSVNQPAYLLVITDGAEKVNSRVKAGDTYQFTADQTIELASGNAAAISVVYGQNDLGIMGNPGEAFHLIFSVNGAFTPTPKASPTATPTKPATMTIAPTNTVPAPTVTPFIP